MDKRRTDLTGFRSLDTEIRRLQKRSKDLENELDTKLEYLQDHYSSMVMKTLFPVIQHKTGIPATVVEMVTQNERIRGSLGRLTNYVLNRVSDGLDFIADKLEKKPE